MKIDDSITFDYCQYDSNRPVIRIYRSPKTEREYKQFSNATLQRFAHVLYFRQTKTYADIDPAMITYWIIK